MFEFPNIGPDERFINPLVAKKDKIADFAQDILDIQEQQQGLKAQLKDTQENLKKSVQEYNANRLMIFETILHDLGLCYCTACHQIEKEEDFELFLIERTKKQRYDVQSGSYRYELFVGLHRLCTWCRQNAYNENGWRSEPDNINGQRETFDVYRARGQLGQDQKYQVEKNGQFQDISNQAQGLPKPPDKIVDKFLDQYGYPPRIVVDEMPHVLEDD